MKGAYSPCRTTYVPPFDTIRVGLGGPKMTSRMWCFVITIFLFLFLAPLAFASEPTPLYARKHPNVITGAEVASTTMVAVALVTETWHAWKSKSRKKAFTCMAIANSVGLLANEITKRAVHRLRPNGEDDKSFYSMHTMLAETNTHWSLKLGSLNAAGTGVLRTVGGDHYDSDVAVGFGAGLAQREMCRW